MAAPETGLERKPLPVIRLAANCRAADPDTMATARVQLAFGDRPVTLEVTLPTGPAQPTDFLPIYQGLANLVVDIAVENVERHGEKVSCAKGCGACCRQPIPISETEARAIARLVSELPEPRRSVIQERFTAARTRLAAAGLLDAFRNPGRVTGVQAMANSAAYFDLGIACPFLEDESCSIYNERPVGCREYLVMSPAANCARPAAGGIQPVPLPARVAAAVRTADRNASVDGAGWVLLALAPDWAAEHPPPPPQPGPAILQQFIDDLLPRTDWVREENLRPFLTALGWAVGADFGPGDWAAVEAGMRATDESNDRWYDFAFACARPARVRLARFACGVRLRPDVPDDLAPQVRLAVGLCQQYRLQRPSD
jgi:Fe-S-cluster containining protein